MDLPSRRCLTSAGTALRYDDLLGADGVNSIVRRAMATADTSPGFRSDAVDLPGQFKVEMVGKTWENWTNNWGKLGENLGKTGM